MPDVTFTSTRFSQTPALDAINNMLGHDLAAWMRVGLIRAAFDVSEVIAEDYGYGFWVILDGSHYWISVSAVESDGLDKRSQWRIGVDYDPGCLWMLRLRRRPKPDHLPHITQAIHTVLKSDLTVHEVAWWAQGVGNDNPTPAPKT